MSASLVHFAVCDDVCRVLDRLSGENTSAEIGKACKAYPNYTRLGSIGPDIPYFEQPVEGGIKMFLDIHVPITPAAYVLHSKTPNVFAVNLFRLIFTDASDLAVEKCADLKLLAFAVGYLTHMATDHIIHPFVNSNAGKYYVSDENKVRHRMIEIYHDVHLFEQMYLKDAAGDDIDVKKEFGRKDFEAKIDIVDESFSETLSEKFWDTELTFRVLLQRAFLETHGMDITEQQIEDWLDGAMLTLSNLNRRVSPYTRALHKPKKKWKDLAFRKGNVSNSKYFYDAEDAIVEFTRDTWKHEAGSGKKPDATKLKNHKSKAKNKSLYAQSILQSLKYIESAAMYIKNKDVAAFIEAVPAWDLSDPAQEKG
ncbi:MAG: zinc dependent phospholipase C family protein [Sedimentisphaerales bacterium]|nr:zinc dependent phospholipase C family protein [Sedimentisphaerales bacterium]